MMKAAGYIRVSTDEQAREGYSLDAQGGAIHKHCELHGWELVDIYADRGRSGKSLKGREGLARLIEDARAGAFECVVFWRLDRLGRSTRDLENIYALLEEASVGVVSIQESFDTTTSAGKAMRGMLGVFAQFERDTIIERITSGLAQKAQQGELLGPLPLGYERGDDNTVAQHPVIAPLIRAAYERYTTGNYSMRDMAAWSVGVGLVSTEGNPLDRMSVRKLLSNPTYTGMVSYHGELQGKGRHDAIVDAALFARVQETMRSRNRYFPQETPFGREPYPLSGTASCDHCAAALVGVSRNVAGKYRYSYYRCSTTHRRGREACEQRMVRTHVLESQIAAYVGGMHLPPEYLGEVVTELRRRHARPDNPEERTALRRQRERLLKQHQWGEIDDGHLRRELSPIKARLAEIEQPFEVLDVEAAVSQIRDLGRLWDESPRLLQRRFVREVFDRIGVDGAQLSALTPKPQYAPLFVLDRRERFGQAGPEFCRLAPGTGFEPVT